MTMIMMEVRFELGSKQRLVPVAATASQFTACRLAFWLPVMVMVHLLVGPRGLAIDHRRRFSMLPEL